MNKLLVLAALVASMTACTGLSNKSAGVDASPGAVTAAELGYHGPVHRVNAPPRD